MTTATPRDKAPGPGAPVLVKLLVGPLVATLLVGAVLVLCAALLSGSAAALGATVGVLVVAGFFGLGATVLGTVARVAPAASLLVALLTYTLQVVLLALVLVLLTRAGVLDGPLSPDWVAGGVILGTLVWISAQTVVATRARQPVYDLPPGPPPGTEEASVR